MYTLDFVFFLAASVSLTFISLLAIGSLIASASFIKDALLAVHIGKPGLTRLAGVVAICLMVAPVGYGVAEMATHFLQVPVQATAAVTREGAMLNSEPQAAARHEPLATSGPPRVATSRDDVESPRECALDKGITQACTYN
jgi:glucose-6-phosphate dehydrogenase assembly protein OpcA